MIGLASLIRIPLLLEFSTMQYVSSLFPVLPLKLSPCHFVEALVVVKTIGWLPVATYRNPPRTLISKFPMASMRTPGYTLTFSNSRLQMRR